MNKVIDFIKEHYEYDEDHSASTGSIYLKVKKNNVQVCKIRLSDHIYTNSTNNDLYITKCANIDNSYIVECGCCRLPLYYDFDRLLQFIEDFVVIKYVNIVTVTNCKKATEIKKANNQKITQFTNEELKDDTNWSAFVNTALMNNLPYKTLSDSERKAVRKLFTAKTAYSFADKLNIINSALKKSKTAQEFNDKIDNYTVCQSDDIQVDQETEEDTWKYIQSHIKQFILNYLIPKYNFFAPVKSDMKLFTKIVNIFTRNVDHHLLEDAFYYLVNTEGKTLLESIDIINTTSSVCNIVNCIKKVPAYELTTKRTEIINNNRQLYDYYVDMSRKMHYYDLTNVTPPETITIVDDDIIEEAESEDYIVEEDCNQELPDCDYIEELNSIGWIKFVKLHVSKDVHMWKDASNTTRSVIRRLFESYEYNYKDAIEYMNSFRTAKEFRNNYKLHTKFYS